MKTISTSAIVALMTASIGLGAVAPALAQDAPPPPAAEAPATDIAKPPAQIMRRGGGVGFFDMARGAEAVEIAIVRLSHAIDLTEEQTVLLEDLKTDALAAAAAFETATQGLRPSATAEGDTAAARPSISERFDNHIALQAAQLAALEAVQPSFTAFFDSLTDDQQAALQPERGDRPGPAGHHGGGFGQRPVGPGNR